MGHFKLFESFINEAKISDYSLDGKTSPKYDKFIAEELAPVIIKTFKKEGFKSLNDKAIVRWSLWTEHQSFEFIKKIDGKDWVFSATVYSSAGSMVVNTSVYINYVKSGSQKITEWDADFANPGYASIDKMSKLTNRELVDKMVELIPTTVKNGIKKLENLIKKHSSDISQDEEGVGKYSVIGVNTTKGLLSDEYIYYPEWITK